MYDASDQRTTTDTDRREHSDIRMDEMDQEDDIVFSEGGAVAKTTMCALLSSIRLKFLNARLLPVHGAVTLQAPAIFYVNNHHGSDTILVPSPCILRLCFEMLFVYP